MSNTAWNVRGLVFSALFAALFIVFSFVKITIGLNLIPFTLQSFALMLAGGLLGARYGFYSIFVVVLLAALGLPLLHGEGGISYVLGGTGGFIVMFPIGALLIGFTSQRIRGKGVIAFILLFLTMYVLGSLLLFVTGVPWLAYSADMSLSKAMTLACYPFLVPDLLKALVASAIVISLRQYVPVLSQRTPIISDKSPLGS
jgi:biotin transport system substrate-specific component